MSPSISSDLLLLVAELRAQAFELVKDIPRSYSDAELSLASVRMQSVANELGVIEGLLGEAAAHASLAQRDAA